MVPFHFFARNPFDGRVQVENPLTTFVLITVLRRHALNCGWKVVPCHPLAGSHIELLDYDSGVATIDWEAMNKRNYTDQLSKSVYMAECLSPIKVMPHEFFSIFVPDKAILQTVNMLLRDKNIELNVNVNSNMFV